MARYRNEDNVLAMFNRFYHMCETREQRTLVLDMKQAFLEIHTADVVPKSEVERLQAEIDRLQKHNTEYARKHYADGYNTAKTEVAPIVGHNDPIGEPGEDGLESSIRYAKAEVARGIFEEIDKRFEALLKFYPLGGEVTDAKKFVNLHWKHIKHSIMCDYDAELKKKRTEGET